MWPGYVQENLLPRVYGFELLMAPYAVAHMKLGLLLRETGYDFSSDERLRVFLTNTLEEAHEMTGLPLFTQWLAGGRSHQRQPGEEGNAGDGGAGQSAVFRAFRQYGRMDRRIVARQR